MQVTQISSNIGKSDKIKQFPNFISKAACQGSFLL